ncbi:YbaB/EbfC family nucleoid-associated protein [Aestuariispira insulae]|uniref:Nucleoid-associated protein DFP90_112110 n=1 Tax=Aestuariispira insulae TaxID=1461337 RepID=A0A3D9H6H3_9PROT|nr:YbaB/EbfC family nucleoid-associated protein [Aestuariispira insulae]RED45117.1 hypothetical protein DFP90_112110 [Aestuariispira insulae]
MFKDLGNLGKMMKQAQEMQNKMQAMQEELMDVTHMGVSGAGMVSVTLNGRGEMKGVSIDPSMLKADEKEILEDLITAAHNDAKVKVEAYVQEKTQEMMGGMKLPDGMKLPF